MKNWFKYYWCRIFHHGFMIDKIEWTGDNRVMMMRVHCKCGAVSIVYPVYWADLPDKDEVL